MDYRPGDIVTKKNREDNDYYIYLGKVMDDEICLPVRSIGVEKQNELGWFAVYPVKPVNGWYESHVPIYAWFVSMLEKVELYTTQNI